MTSDLVSRAVLVTRTVRNLRPAQVGHRIRLRAQRFPPSHPSAAGLLRLLPAPRRPLAAWPAGFVPMDLQVPRGVPSPEDNAGGRFTFLDDQRDLGLPVRWEAPGASRLWRYHLHYFDFAWTFAAHPDPGWARAAYAGLWQSWESAVPFGRGDPWHPYVASLRAWAICGTYGALVVGSRMQQTVDASLVRHARFLRWHVEHDVGGNHLVKNLKALVGLGIFLADDRQRDWAVAQISRQAAVQVLRDGGHYERSPSYHAQVLGDFLDVAALLESSGRPAVPELTAAIEAMRKWLGIMLLPDGDVPLFNDCVLVGPDRLAALVPGPPAAGRLTVLGDSGYVVVRRADGLQMVADVGDPCPPDLPAHAHADCLSFELADSGRRLIVDPGTSTYEPGPSRARERSTSAHNTVTVDGANQTEVWATFRAARLAHGTLELADDDGETVTIVASHDGYRRLPGSPVHRRTWRLTADSVAITDEVAGGGAHEVVSRVRLAEPQRVRVSWHGPAGLRVTDRASTYATAFGRWHHARVISARWSGALPVTLQLGLHIDDTQQRGS